jgi:IS30 family transposase
MSRGCGALRRSLTVCLRTGRAIRKPQRRATQRRGRIRVERATRFVMLLHLPDKHGALEVRQAMIETMGRLPEFLRKSVTGDQGKERASHAEIRIALDMDIYFCDTHSPWQRGSNEITNGVLRRSGSDSL